MAPDKVVHMLTTAVYRINIPRAFLTEHLGVSHHYYAMEGTEINKYDQPMVVGGCSAV
jgi:hypothetical protein